MFGGTHLQTVALKFLLELNIILRKICCDVVGHQMALKSQQEVLIVSSTSGIQLLANSFIVFLAMLGLLMMFNFIAVLRLSLQQVLISVFSWEKSRTKVMTQQLSAKSLEPLGSPHTTRV